MEADVFIVTDTTPIPPLGDTAVDWADRLEEALEKTDDPTGTAVAGIRLDQAIAGLRQLGTCEATEGRRLLAFPYAAVTNALATLRGIDRPSAEHLQLAIALTEAMQALRAYINTPPPLPRKSKAPEQHRKSPRVELETAVTFESTSNFYTGLGGNLSEGGVFIETYELLPIGTEVDLQFALPGGFVVKTRGVVRWIRDTRATWDGVEDPSPGMGIQFDAVPPAASDAIKNFMRQRSPRFHEE